MCSAHDPLCRRYSRTCLCWLFIDRINSIYEGNLGFICRKSYTVILSKIRKWVRNIKRLLMNSAPTASTELKARRYQISCQGTEFCRHRNWYKTLREQPETGKKQQYRTNPVIRLFIIKIITECETFNVYAFLKGSLFFNMRNNMKIS